jgi:hypothetical protein
MNKINCANIELNRRVQQTQSRYLKGISFGGNTIRSPDKTIFDSDPPKFKRKLILQPYTTQIIRKFLIEEEMSKSGKMRGTFLDTNTISNMSLTSKSNFDQESKGKVVSHDQALKYLKEIKLQPLKKIQEVNEENNRNQNSSLVSLRLAKK